MPLDLTRGLAAAAIGCLPDWPQVEVMLLSTRQWGTRLSVGLVHTTKAYQLCTTSTWLGAEGSGSVAIGYIVE